VMPTVLALLGVPAPPMDGVSLTGLMKGKERALNLAVYSESQYPRRLGWSPLRGLRDGRFKFIDAPRPELYDLEHDPYELRNLYNEQPELAQVLAKRLAAFDRPGREADNPATPDPQLARRLGSLGYVAASATPWGAADAERAPDPKDCIVLYRGRQETIGMAAFREMRCD
jgi:choline-sulfatase